MTRSIARIGALSCMLGSIWAAELATNPAGETTVSPIGGDIANLKAQLDEQRKLIEQLRLAVNEQKRLLQEHGIGVAAQPAAGQPVVPADVLIASRAPLLTPVAPATPAASKFDSAPLQFRIGDVTILPVGFMDATAVWRDKDAGTGIGTNFGSIPYGNSTAGKLTEFRFSPQNSRVGFRVDGNWKGAHFIGYNEFDFLGSSGANNLGVTNGAFVPRLRLFWVDVRKRQWEVLAGQSWSLLTPNRSGLSALPGDLFYSQVIDVNYMLGLPWTRQAGARFLYHPSEKLTVGVSLENPNQYIGGSAGGSSIVLPSGLTALAGSQLDNASNVLVTPNVHPDVIVKIAFDPNSRVHFEIAGLARTFKVWNPSNNQYSSKSGGGGSINGNFEVVRNLRVITNNYWSDGGGRYLFGQAPDVVVRADGSLSPIHAGGTVDGFEATVHKKILLYAYYGGIYIGRNVAIDANGTSLVGYGYRGSANSQNRALQEITFGFNQTLWKDPRYGALNLMGQYQYVMRKPWFVAVNAPKGTHDNTVYMNLRYTLPGSVPTPK